MHSIVADPRPLREIENLWIPLADGTRLAARVWLPEDAESDPVPAILEYLPYRKRDGTRGRDNRHHRPVAEAGYAVLRVDIRGTGGVRLRDKWRDGPRSYLGLAVAGFPNVFTVTGPGSPSVFSNMVLSVEHDMDWISDCLTFLRERDWPTFEADPAAQASWMDHVDDVARHTLLNKAASWYRGANVEGKPH